MKILITGGAGFIGSNFIRHLLGRMNGECIVNLDMLTYAGQEESLAEFEGRRGYQFIRTDITERDQIERVLATGFDAVVHFAAESHVDRSISGPDPFIHTNIVGTHCLIEAARRAGIRRFIQISSDEVYGPMGDDGHAGPDAPLKPSNAYAASKASADLLVGAAVRTHGFPGIITRCTNNYGPWQHPEKFIPLLITRALQGGVLPIYGDGLQERDWIHVDDHCRALEAILHAGVPGRIYTIAGGYSLRNLDLARQILRLAGAHGARIEHVQDRPGHDRRYALDDSATRAAFAWEPRLAFAEGLAQTISWYMENRSWWQPITATKPSLRRARVGST